MDRLPFRKYAMLQHYLGSGAVSAEQRDVLSELRSRLADGSISVEAVRALLPDVTPVATEVRDQTDMEALEQGIMFLKRRGFKVRRNKFTSKLIIEEP